MMEILSVDDIRKKLENYPDDLLPLRVAEILRDQMAVYYELSKFSNDYYEGALAAFSIADMLMQKLLTSSQLPSKKSLSEPPTLKE
jgi:hypothetical protein